jgi:hypothetical protein
MYKNATKCNETIGKWCKNKHGASKIIDTFETYHFSEMPAPLGALVAWGTTEVEAAAAAVAARDSKVLLLRLPFG